MRRNTTREQSDHHGDPQRSLFNNRPSDPQRSEIQLVRKAINKAIRKVASLQSSKKPHCAEISLVRKVIIKGIRRVRPLMSIQVIRIAATSRSGRFTTISQVLRTATKYNW